MKIKKIIAAMCAAAAVLSLAGCEDLLEAEYGNNNSTNVSVPAPSPVKQSVVPSGATSDEPTTSMPVGENARTVSIHINFYENWIFSTYDVKVIVDGVHTQTLKHGESADLSLALEDGEHTLAFENKDDSEINGSVTFIVAGETTLSYTINCHFDEVIVTDENNSGTIGEVSEPESSQTESNSVQEETVYTFENCSELQSLIYLNRVVDEAEIKAFAEKYDGKTIELEMLTTFVENNRNYKTRFNYLLNAVQNDKVMLAGPTFMLEDVNYYDLNLIGDNVPDSFGIGIHCRVKAEVEGYDSAGQWILLDPVSIEVIKIY